MARRKNTKRIDPRYFLNETTNRDEIDEGKETLAQWEAVAITPEEVKKDEWEIGRFYFNDSINYLKSNPKDVEFQSWSELIILI